MMRTWLAVLAGIGLAIYSNPARAANPSTADEQKAFEWFGGLGFPDVKEAKLVRVLTGRWSQSGNEPPQNMSMNAFLLKGGDEFTVLTLSLETETFKKTPDDAPEHERVAFEPLDLKVEAEAEIKSIRARLAAEQSEPFRRFGERLPERAEVFVLAWGCWRHGLVSEAHDLYSLAARMPSQGGDRSRPGKAFPQAVADDIAHSQMWRLIEDFGDPQISRDQLLERFRGFIRHYPHSEHIERAKKTAELLATMVREDAEHAERLKTALPFEKLGVKDQIADLIFQLRDQNGHQWSQPGACDIFSDPRDALFGEPGKGKSPASRLVAMGYDAIPQLIEALDDERFTRSVGFHRDFYFSHFVLRIGDCAEEIISRIAGRTFYRRTTTYGAMLKDNQTRPVKAEIEAWHAELLKKGEKQVLIEAVERGDRNSPSQAAQLVKKYPEAALDAIKGGLKAAEKGWTHAALLEAAGGISGDAPLDLLLEELQNSTDVRGRVVAARALRRRGRPEALEAMIAAWTRPTDAPLSKEQERREEAASTDRELYEVAEFLASSTSPAAIDALGKNLEERPVELRVKVISALDDERPEDVGKESDALRQSVERLLVGLLDDEERRMGMGGSWGGKSFSDPRVCDLAGHVLNVRWPEKYAFDLSASLRSRERARIALKNVWRKEHGLQLLPPPEEHGFAPLPDERVAPLIDRLLAADKPEQTAAMAAIEELGLGALPAMKARLMAIKADEAASVRLNAALRRVASIVADVRQPDRSRSDAPEWSKQLSGLKGKPLAGEPFAEVLIAFLQDRQETGELRLTATRFPGEGVVLTARILGKPRQARSAPSHAFNVRAGKKELLDSVGTSIGISSASLGLEMCHELIRSIDEALSASDEVEVEIHASMQP